MTMMTTNIQTSSSTKVKFWSWI